MFVYRNKKAAAQYAVGSLVVMAGCISLIFMPHGAVESALGHVRRLAIAYIGAPVCALACISFIRDMIAGAPVLAVDDNGVTVRQEPMIPWSEITDVKTFTKNGKAYLGIFPTDLSRLLSRYPESAAKRFKLVNEQMMGAVAVVAAETLPVRLDVVMAEIDEFCKSKIAVA